MDSSCGLIDSCGEGQAPELGPGVVNRTLTLPIPRHTPVLPVALQAEAGMVWVVEVRR